MSRLLLPAALAALLATPTAEALPPADSTPVNDALFAQAAAASGMGEVAVSELGQKKAEDSKLKEFSEKAAADHAKMNQELAALAAKKGIALPAQLDARSQFCIQSLSGEPKDSFDACYAKAQLAIHIEAVGAFEAEAQRGRDPDLKALAEKALPKIKEHLHMLKPIVMKYENKREEGSDKSAK